MDKEAWHAAIFGVTKSWTQLSDWTELKYPLEIEKLIFKIMWKSKRTRIAKITLTKKKKIEFMLLNLWIYYKASAPKAVWPLKGYTWASLVAQ